MAKNLKVGDKVLFNYRGGADLKGTISGVIKRGTTPDTTMYNIKPSFADGRFKKTANGVPVHRSGAKLRKQG